MGVLVTSADGFNKENRLTEMIPGLRKQGNYWIGPCPFCGGKDRFNVKEADGRDLWICRQCGNGKYQDAIAYVMRSTGKSFLEVIGDGSTRPPLAPRARPQRSPITIATPPDEQWQETAQAAAVGSAAYLWGDSSDAAAARRYLTENRMLLPETIERAGLGFNPTRRKVAGRVLEPGITIPCRVDGVMWYLQVRTMKSARDAAQAAGWNLGKYSCLGGSKLFALYGADELLSAESAFVTEGEFDALALGQYCPPGVSAVTMGSAMSIPERSSWARYFSGLHHGVFVLMDNDDAGRAAMERWQKAIPCSRPVRLPDDSKDVTDFIRAGGDSAAWVSNTLGEHGINRTMSRELQSARIAELESIISEYPDDGDSAALEGFLAEYDGLMRPTDNAGVVDASESPDRPEIASESVLSAEPEGQ